MDENLIQKFKENNLSEEIYIYKYFKTFKHFLMRDKPKIKEFISKYKICDEQKVRYFLMRPYKIE